MQERRGQVAPQKVDQKRERGGQIQHEAVVFVGGDFGGGAGHGRGYACGFGDGGFGVVGRFDVGAVGRGGTGSRG